MELFGNTCQHCGIEDIPEIYDFHHIDPTQKEFGIAEFFDRKFSSLEEEIKKCILLCANCHRKEHVRLRLEMKEIKV